MPAYPESVAGYLCSLARQGRLVAPRPHRRLAAVGHHDGRSGEVPLTCWRSLRTDASSPESQEGNTRAFLTLSSFPSRPDPDVVKKLRASRDAKAIYSVPPG
jgi:hypothetical protein